MNDQGLCFVGCFEVGIMGEISSSARRRSRQRKRLASLICPKRDEARRDTIPPWQLWAPALVGPCPSLELPLNATALPGIIRISEM